MEVITFEKDISLLCVTATSFPDGVMDAHKKLHSLVPFSTDRRFFGLSRPESNKGIIYTAAAEELSQGEADKLNCDSLILTKGEYICLRINDFMKDIPAIGKAFQQLLANPEIDPQGYCVEWYFNDQDVKCMIRLKGK